MSNTNQSKEIDSNPKGETEARRESTDEIQLRTDGEERFRAAVR